MAQIVKLRRSSVSGQKPTNSNLQLGELALNTTDGKVYMAVSGSGGPSIQELVSTNTVNTGSINLIGAISASHISSSFIGDGSGLYNIPLSGVTNLVTVSGSLDSRLDVLEAYSSSQLVPSASMSFRTLQTDVYCKNVTGVQINKGTVVRIVGATGDNPLIAPADLLTEGNSANTLGIATEDIPNDSFGLIITEGVLTGVNTNGMTAGALLYLGANGTFTTTPPTAPNHGVRLGEVLRVQQNNGSIYVRIDNGIELNEAHDVIYSGISHGDLLVRSGSVWKNSKALEGNYTVTGSLTITQNLTVLGSSSITYITSSQLQVATSVISVNVFEPAERFGGLKVYDSGSLSHQATASLLWDSQNNHWIYQNASGSQYSGGMLLSGPRNSGSLGDEPGLIDGRIVKSVGGDHLDVSIISETGTTINIDGNLNVDSITGSIDFSNITNKPTLVSGSSQISYTGITDVPNGIVSGSSQIVDLGFTTTSSLESFTSSYNTDSQSFDSRINNFTASINSLNTFSSSVVLTSQTSSMTVLSASYAVTAAFALNAGSGGSGGAALGSYALLEQTTSATTWSFVHNTGQRYPIFQVFNSNGDVIIPTQIRTINENSAEIIFGSAQTGTAIASLGGGNGTTQEFTNSALWTVDHNLGTDYPDVTIWDSNRNIIFPNRIESVNNNQIKVYFSVPVSGHVSVSRGGHILQGGSGVSSWNDLEDIPSGLVSGSSQISFSGISGKPSGLVSGSSQISYTNISNIPSGIVSGSDQLTGSYDTRYVLSGSITQTTWDNIANKPTGIVSGSVQVELTGTTGYSTFSSSINTSISGSVSNLSSSIASIDSTQNGRLNSLETTSSSLLILSSSIDNAFEFTGSNVTVKGDFLVKGTTTTVNSTTLDIGDNIISLNGSGVTNAGLIVRDVTNPNTTSGSLLWDSTNDYWIAGDLGNEERIILEGEFNGFTSSYNTGSFTGSFIGDGSGLTNLSNITGSVGQVAILSSNKTVSGSQFTYVTNQTFGLGTDAVNNDSPERLMVDSFNSYNIATFQTSQQETYAEVNIKNFGSGSSSSADLVIWNNVTTPSSSFLDLGINSSNYNAGYVGYGGDGYLFNDTNDLYLGSMDTLESGHGHVHIFGGGMWDSSSISIYSDGTIGINTDKENTSASTIPSSVGGYAVEISGSVNFRNGMFVTGSVVISGSLDISNANVGSSRYLHTQSSTSTTWNITHNLGYSYPNVTVYDGSNNKVMLPSDITSVNENTTQVTFATPEYGYALVSVGGVTTATADRYLHTVSSATGSWVINHNFNYKYVNIDVYDNNDEQLIPQKVTAVSANTVQVDFATPTSGNAIITTGGPRSTSIFNQTGSFYNTNYNIGITGSLVVTGDVDAENFNTTSDEKLKTNLERIEGALDKIEKLNGYTFNWLESYNNDRTRQIGMLANEVHSVQPELTTQRDILLNGEEERILLLDYSKVTALLIEAVKELSDKVKNLENKNK